MCACEHGCEQVPLEQLFQVHRYMHLLLSEVYVEVIMSQLCCLKEFASVIGAVIKIVDLILMT